MDVLEAILKNNPNLVKVKLTRKEFNINDTIFNQPKDQKKKKIPIATPLVYACENELPQMVKLIIKHGADLNKASEDVKQRIPLYAATLSGNLEIVKILVDKKVNIDHISDSGLSGLHGAVEKDHHEIVKYLIEQKADVNILHVNSDKGSPLYHASGYGRKPDCAKLLLENGAKVDLKVSNGTCTPFLNSVKNGKSKIMETILDNGADINAKENGKSAMYLAVENIKKKCIKGLLDKNADIIDKYEGKTPLSLALSMHFDYDFDECEEEIEKLGYNAALLLLKKYPLEELERFFTYKKDEPAVTMLMHAILLSKPSVVRYLLEQGCSAQTKNENGDTTFHHLFYSSRHSGVSFASAEALLEYKADPDVKNNAGITPLYYMLKTFKRFNSNNSLKVLDLMLDSKYKIDINQKDQNGDTPLILVAGSYPLNEAFDILLKHGGDINAANRDGQTALHFCCMQTRSYSKSSYHKDSTVKHLLDAGAKQLKNRDEQYPVFLSKYDNDIRYFLEVGYDANYQDCYGNTLIHHIVKHEIKKYNTSGASFKIEAILKCSTTLDLTIKNKTNKTIHELIAQKEVNVTSLVAKLDKYMGQKSSTTEIATQADKKQTSSTKDTKSSPATAKLKKSPPSSASSKTKESKSSLSRGKANENGAKVNKITVSRAKSRANVIVEKEPPVAKHLKAEPTTHKSVKQEAQELVKKDTKPVEKDTKPVQKKSSTPEPEQTDDEYDNITDVMISYQWDSQKIAVKIFEHLSKKEKLNVWMDINDMRADMNEAMAQGVAFSSLFIMCMSSQYAVSENCKKEFSYADRLRKPIIPVKVESSFTPARGTALDLIVGANIYYDLDKDFNNQILKLSKDIKAFLEDKK